MGVSTANFIRTLEEIDMRWGSLEAYLAGPIGLAPADFDTLRDRYLV